MEVKLNIKLDKNNTTKDNNILNIPLKINNKFYKNIKIIKNKDNKYCFI